MSTTGQGPGWWIASDGKWYPPEQHPSARAAWAPPAGPAASAAPAVGTFDFAAGPPGMAPALRPERRGPAPHSFKLAIYGSRALAYVVDVVVTVVVSWALLVIGSLIDRGGGVLLGLVPVVVFSLWYHVWKIGTAGQTWGMRVLQIAVADKATGRQPVGVGRAFVRALVAFGIGLVPFAGIVDLLWPLWDPYNQTLHDKAASTVVLNHS